MLDMKKQKYYSLVREKDKSHKKDLFFCKHSVN